MGRSLTRISARCCSNPAGRCWSSPARAIPAKRFSKMLIAWKPTRETTRAVHDAIAFLSPGSAEVLAIDPEVSVFEHGAEPGADIAAHLARHGIRTQVTTRPSASQSIAQVVMAHAKDTGADLVVAGGYGHGRLARMGAGWRHAGTVRRIGRAGAVFTLRRGRPMCGIPNDVVVSTVPGGKSSCSRASCTRSSGSSVDRSRTQRALRVGPDRGHHRPGMGPGPGCVAPAWSLH
jgi:nucleotide-binding universal stress UspA family protein